MTFRMTDWQWNAGSHSGVIWLSFQKSKCCFNVIPCHSRNDIFRPNDIRTLIGHRFRVILPFFIDIAPKLIEIKIVSWSWYVPHQIWSPNLSVFFFFRFRFRFNLRSQNLYHKLHGFFGAFSGLIHQISNKIALNSIWQTYTWQTAVYPALLFCVGNSSGWQLEPSSFSFLKKTKTKQCPRHYRTGCHQNWLCPSNTRQHQFLTFFRYPFGPIWNLWHAFIKEQC